MLQFVSYLFIIFFRGKHFKSEIPVFLIHTDNLVKSVMAEPEDDKICIFNIVN